jgi:hypothetical protein
MKIQPLIFTYLLLLSIKSWAIEPYFQNVNKDKLFDQTVQEVERLDAEILSVRENRPESWKQTVAKIKQRFLQAQSDEEAYHALQSLDATYPGLHTTIHVPSDHDAAVNLFQNFQLPFTFYPKKNGAALSFLVGQVLDSVKNLIQPGDELGELENVSMPELNHDAFLFCDYAQAYPCSQEFYQNFHRGFLRLNLKDRATIRVTIKRNHVEKTIAVPIVTPKEVSKFSTDSTMSASSCFKESRRYPKAIPLYLGTGLCLYQTQQPAVGVLRLASFGTRMDKAEKWVSFAEDFEKFLLEWKKYYPKWRALILDMANNGGGDVPVRLTKLLVHQPFQDQWVRFKNIAEFKDPLFFTEPYNSKTLAGLLEANKNFTGTFFPPIPQFPIPDKEATALYDPDPNVFSGQIVGMVDRGCISSCTGFLWTLHRYAKDKLTTVGRPDSGDSTYERINIIAFKDPLQTDGFKIHILPTNLKIQPGWQSLFNWTVSVSLTTDRDGLIYSMKPDPVDHWVDDQPSYAKWIAAAYKKALAIAKAKSDSKNSSPKVASNFLIKTGYPPFKM